MFLRPFLVASVRQKLYSSSIKNSRTLRPSIKIGKDTFQLSLDVHYYNKDELRVKAHPEYVVIEGKQEKATQQGYILRQFIRKFKIPDGCIPSKIKCSLSSDGMLTITAPRKLIKDSNSPAETVSIPISYGPPNKLQEGNKIDEQIDPAKPKTYANPCDNFPKVQPKGK